MQPCLIVGTIITSLNCLSNHLSAPSQFPKVLMLRRYNGVIALLIYHANRTCTRARQCGTASFLSLLSTFCSMNLLSAGHVQIYSTLGGHHANTMSDSWLKYDWLHPCILLTRQMNVKARQWVWHDGLSSGVQVHIWCGWIIVGLLATSKVWHRNNTWWAIKRCNTVFPLICFTDVILILLSTNSYQLLRAVCVFYPIVFKYLWIIQYIILQDFGRCQDSF